jgi:protoporphyrinogen oxidase
MGKQSIAVVGSGPAGLAAAFALHNDLERKYDVAVFEMVSSAVSSFIHCMLTID